MKIKIVTIGVYGSTAAGFFDALREARVDTFCDIRWRRGVRGSEYVYANSARLQRHLADLGIRYFHCRELSPDPTLRQRQNKADEATGTAKRQRTTLSDDFIRGYCRHHLAEFDSRGFVDQFGPEARTVALFCVEREPTACHRSLLAERLHHDLGLKVVHLFPD